MDDSVTISIAQFIGPVLLAVGLGIFFSRNYYTKIYRNLEQETLAVYIGGITTLVAGIAIVLHHNVWTSLLTGIVSAIGWLCVLKGLILIISPKTAEYFGDKVSGAKFFSFLAVVAMALGAYLTYFVYMFYVLS